ncbi:MAG: Glucose dehydrogenase/Glucose dehydrogenase/Glucose dehydrogenase [Verrucomicrobia bacterium]|nr:MAG: Glucose dehydrogenase/Glucose dehydrogenase/Glucose dehydrogenase [Verrucomicrobiota bacterium]
MKTTFLLNHTLSALAAFALSALAPPVQAATPPSQPASAAPAQKSPELFRSSNLAAWCIVPFDKGKRNPEQRAEMLEKLGFSKFVYDYRKEHILEWDAEMEALKRHHVDLTGWWFPGSLNPEALTALELFRKHHFKPQLWVSGGGGSLKADSAEEQARRVANEVRRLKPIAEAARADGLTVGLYNHGSWFGEPDNQIEILNALKAEGFSNVGLVYNQHHGHGHIEGFKELLERMKPHLIFLNLNGMDIRGDQVGRKILPLGIGTEDLSLLKIIAKSGYTGPIGILNHTGEDAEARLQDNLEGLRWLTPQLQGDPAGPKPVPRSFNATPAPAGAKAAPSSASATSVPSLSPAFGNALHGSLALEGKDSYRTPPLSVECRAKLNSATSFNILVASDTKASADHWELYTYSKSGFLSLYMPGRGGEIRSEINVCDGTWHALAATIGPEKVRLYVDGKLVKEAPLRPRVGTPIPGGLALGALVEGRPSCDGLLDNVRISSGEREISAPGDAPLKTDATTLGLWDFEALPATPAQAAAIAPIPELDRSQLASSFILPAAKPERLTPANGWPSDTSSGNWERSLGGPTSNRFSNLKQITRENVAQLEPAWTYRSGDGNANIQCNPIVVHGTMFTPTPGKNIVAVDAATGKERWRFAPKTLIGGESSNPARRGLLYWKGDAIAPPRLLFGDGNWLIALHPDTGLPVEGFGTGGKTQVPTGTTAVGALHGHIFVLPGYGGDVYGFDARDGKLLWTFKTRPPAGEFGNETWSKLESGANCWGGMAMDESRGIAFISLGSPKPNFIGINHQGDNLFSNCVLALDATNGKRLWHFQELRHDIWDWDIPAPPNLVTVERHGRRVDALAQVTKLGNTLLLDRVTGEPLYDFRFVRVDTHGLPGDSTAVYQPAPELPQPFARQAYTRADMPSNPEARAALLPLLDRANLGPFPSFDEARPTLLFNIHGGAEWTGAAADPKGFLYVTSNEIPWSITCFRDDDPAPLLPPSAGEQIYQTNCSACHGPDRKGLGHAPPMRGLRHRLAEPDVRAILKTGRASMPPMPHLTEEQLQPLLDFVLCRDRPSAPQGASKGKEWTFSGFNRLLDSNGYPACSTPWGTLNCINLNTGETAWSVPLGEYPELKEKGVPKTGQENFGGAIVTSSGLVFVSGTRDKKIRAFDASTGAELWSQSLPLHGTAPPSSYEAEGRQFILQPATGGGKLGGPAGDTWVAFALPKGRLADSR